ncbi:MAG: hypothetical protein GOMPHAMPRED_001041 [Gomphillus americanus]|uniref:Uncharacterized protein n=1 Tax=Gomphillus americanus TaxID=1940652 RepID=A0A8H3F1D9_9LECA|nr:MAG: hypothetical protein GOMPHAMPRED_001041 [Gomphillus americanus]
MALSNQVEKPQEMFSKLKNTLTTVAEIRNLLVNLYNHYGIAMWCTLLQGLIEADDLMGRLNKIETKKESETDPETVLSLAKDVQACFQDGLAKSTNVAQYDLFHKEIAHVNEETVVCNGYELSWDEFLAVCDETGSISAGDSCVKFEDRERISINAYLAARAALRGIEEAD